MNTKKILAVLLTLGIVSSLCACNKDKPTETTNGSDVTNATSIDTIDTTVDIQEPDVTVPFDLSSVDWENMYAWDGTTITGLSQNVPEEVKANGVIVIPAKCTVIGQTAFKGEKWIKEVQYEDINSVLFIEYGAFFDNKNIHNFVMPTNSTLINPDSPSDRGCSFINDAEIVNEANLHNLVLPNGMVAYKLAQYFGAPGAVYHNQFGLENVYVPANFSIYNDSSIREGWEEGFCKYTQEWFETTDDIKVVSTREVLADKFHNVDTPCHVWVVEGSWADQNFEKYFKGDLIVKEYWDGTNFELPNRGYYDVEKIKIRNTVDKTELTFYSFDGDYEVKDKDRNLVGNLTSESFNSFADNIVNLVSIPTSVYPESTSEAKYIVEISSIYTDSRTEYFVSDTDELAVLIGYTGFNI